MPLKEALVSNKTGFSDEETWPNLWDESREMMEAAVLMYAFADLRALERKGKLQVSTNQKSLLQLPVQVGHVVRAFEHNFQALKDQIGGDVDFYLSSLSSIEASWARQSLHQHDQATAAGAEVIYQGKTSQLVVFDDDKAHSELVYGIGLNHSRKRITVAFRGSVTLKDFITDAKALLTQVASPVAGETMGIHHGFHDYLLGTKRKGGDTNNKCTEILNHVTRLQQDNPGYRLYVTGHSLGAAIATLFAVEAAGDERVRGTITSIGIASPRVGNMAFRRAVQSLEKQGRLRCLRISNHKDLVTLLPDRGSFSCAYILCCQRNVYRHVGMEIKLYSPSRFQIARASNAEASYGTVFVQDWWRQVRNGASLVLTLPFVCCCREDFLKYHGCREYMERLLGANEHHLRAQQLNDLYTQHTL